MALTRRPTPTWEPVPLATAELASPSPQGPPTPVRLVRRLGRLRVPIAGPYRPWATLYRLPDGRDIWCLRLWEEGHVVRRCVSTATLLAYARRSHLRQLEREIEALRGGTP